MVEVKSGLRVLEKGDGVCLWVAMGCFLRAFLSRDGGFGDWGGWDITLEALRL
jgi:hypothetical protein